MMKSSNLESAFGVLTVLRKHNLVSDVQSTLGGQDLGMNPHELLEAALASCTLMTVRMYALRKGIDTQNMTVQIKIVNETKELTEFQRTIIFPTNLSVEEKSRLLEIADKCPIHRLLTGAVKIQTLTA